MQPRTTILRDNQEPPPPPPPSSSSPNPSVSHLKHKPSSNRKQKWSKENVPPPPHSSDPNSMRPDSPSVVAGKHSPAVGKMMKSPHLHLPPRPPSSNPLKRKLNMDTMPHSNAIVTPTTDSGVKVTINLRNPNFTPNFIIHISICFCLI